MSKNLAKLLDKPEVLVESAIKKLEDMSGWQSTDVRLLAEVNNKVRAKTKHLGLDPDDTTGPELYHALRVKLGEDQAKFNLSTNELIEKISKVHKPYKVYTLKHSVAKEFLRAHPPRHLMKQLNYRSIDSMLKRENVCALYATLPEIESSRWQNVFWKDLAKLTSSDFETQDVEVINLTDKRWEKADSAVSSSVLVGAVYVRQESSGMDLALQIANNINELRTACAYIKLRQVEPNFGKNLVEFLQSGTNHPLEISHQQIGWQTIFHHYGRRQPVEHTEFFGPHILHDDIKAHYPLQLLAKISPVFSWWSGLEHVAKRAEDGIVSFNLADVLASSGLEYRQRSTNHMHQALWHKLIDRYLEHSNVEQHFMPQLEPQTIPIEDYRPTQAEEQEIRQLMEAGV